MTITSKQKILVVLLLVVFTAFVFVAFTTSKDASSFPMLSKDSEELVAHADMSGGGANAESKILTATAWTAGGIGRQSATNLNSISFDANNVSYYRTTGSGAKCSITPGTGSFEAGEYETHQAYSPTLYVIAWVKLDSNLQTIRAKSTLQASITGNVTGDKDVRWGIISAASPSKATSSWPDNNTKTITVNGNYIGITARTNSGWWYSTRIRASGLSLTVTSNDTTTPSVSMIGYTTYGGKNYATSTSSGFNASDSGVGLGSFNLQFSTFNQSSFSDVGNGSSSITLSGAGRTNIWGDYRAVATDLVGNTTTSGQFRYWLPTMKLVSQTGGTQYIGENSTSTDTEIVRRPGQTFYLRAKPELGYLFDGFNISVSGLNSGMTNNIAYSACTYNQSTGWFHYEITLSDNLINTGGAVSEIKFNAIFRADVIKCGTNAPQTITYDGATHPLVVSDDGGVYLSIGSIGSDREWAITGYKKGAGSYSTDLPQYADTYSARIVVRGGADSTRHIIYATYEFANILIVNRRIVTLDFQSSDKVYNGNNSAAIHKLDVVNGVSTDNLTRENGTAYFSDKNVANNKTVTVSGFSISGSNLHSYVYKNGATSINLDDQGGGLGTIVATHNITRANTIQVLLQLKSAHANKEKEYDASNTVDTSWFEPILTGKIGTDNIYVVTNPYPTAITYSSTGGDEGGKDTGSHYFKSVNIKIAGTDIGNYSSGGVNITLGATFAADSTLAVSGQDRITIKPKQLGINVSANHKIYDGNTSTTGQVVLNPAPFERDTIILKTASISYNFANKHVGTNKTVTASGMDVDTSASTGQYNYLISWANNTTTANITTKDLTISMSCSGKVFDGGVSVNLSTLTFVYDGIVASDGNVTTGIPTSASVLSISNAVVFEYAGASASTSVTVSAINTTNQGGEFIITGGGSVLSGSSAQNYLVKNTSLSDTSEITPKPITAANVTITALNDITYDGESHTPTPTLTDIALSRSLLSGTDFSHSFSKDNIATTPKNHGTYTITITGNNNYTGSRTTLLTITKANVILNVQDITITYGDIVDQTVISGTAVNSENGDLSVKGTWLFDPSKQMPPRPKYVDTGEYYVRFTLDDSEEVNYNEPSLVTITLTVNKKQLNVTANTITQVFGEDAIPLSYTSLDALNPSAGSGIIPGDTLDVNLACVKNIPDGKIHARVGNYPITRVGADAEDSDYSITFTNGMYKVTKREITITPISEQKKVYGNTELPLAYIATDRIPTLQKPLQQVIADSPLLGALQREDTAYSGGTGNAGKENVGLYKITQGSLKTLNNADYDITFAEQIVAFEITRRPIEVSAPNLTQVYGEAILSFDYAVTGGSLVAGDTLTGSFSRTLNAQSTDETTNVNVGNYVLRDNLVATQSFAHAPNNPNYHITSVTNGSYKIVRRPLTVTPDSGQGKVYGDPEPTLDYTLSYTDSPEKIALIGDDRLLGALSRENAGETVGRNVGDYNILLGNLRSDNYELTLAPVIFKITRKPIVVTAKLWGVDYGKPAKADTDLTWATFPTALPHGDTLVGCLELDRSWTLDDWGCIPVGSYNILQGTVDETHNPNYTIAFNGENRYVVNRLIANILPHAGQNAIYGTPLTGAEGGGIYDEGIKFSAYTTGNEKIAASYFTGRLEISTTTNIPTPNQYDIVIGTLTSDTHEIVMNRIVISEGVVEDVNPTKYTINKRAISIQPVTIYQVFGEDEITTTSYDIVSGSVIGGDQLLGTLQTPGQGLTVGEHSIAIGSVEHEYYNITLVNNTKSYKVTRRPITIFPQDATSVYGSPTESEIQYSIDLTAGFTSNYPAIIDGYNLTGKLSRAQSDIRNADAYEIILGNLSNNNYEITMSAEKKYYTITPRPVTIKADNKEQVFGNAPLALSYSFVGSQRPAPWDSGLSAATVLTREPGNIVGTYTINKGNISDPGINPNYEITFNTGTYTIVQRRITIVPLPNQFKVYDTAEQPLNYIATTTYSGNAIVAGFPLTGTLTREEGENVGLYRIQAGSLTNENGQNPNYLISFDNTVNFEILRAESFITFNDTTTLDNGEYVLNLIYNATGQSIDAKLNHSETEITYSITNKFRNAGIYNVVLSAAETTNYEATSEEVKVTISPYALPNIIASELVDNLANLTKVYGDMDESLVKSVDGFEADNKIIVTLTRAPGQAVGKYDVSISNISDTNYSIALATNAGKDAYEITKRNITLNQIPISSKVYDGIAEASAVLNYETGYLGDTVKITVNKATGANAGSYDIVSHSIDHESQHNYSISITDIQDKFVVTKRPVTVTANNITIQYGDTNINLSYTVANPTLDTGLIEGESLVGALTRGAGNNAGTYVISCGSLINNNNPNYNITFINGTYKITKVAITVTPDAKNVEYGLPALPLTYTIDRALIGSDTLVGSLSREDTLNVGSYNITRGTLTDTNNPNYSITFTLNVKYTITKSPLTIIPDSVEQVYGENVMPVRYQIVSGNLAYDETRLYGNLGRSGTEVGTYDVTIGTLGDLNPNYLITLENNTGKYKIVRRQVTFTADSITQVYGDLPHPLTYTVTYGSIIEGDVFSGGMESDGLLSQGIGRYSITGATIYNRNYLVTFVNGSYNIIPRQLVIAISDQESQYKENEADLVFDGEAFTIAEGSIADGDDIADLNVILTKEAGKDMGDYIISGSHNNPNYSVAFIDGLYIIHKYQATITTAETTLRFLFDGLSKHIFATCDSGAEIRYSVNGEKVNNAFINPGVYNVVLTADELENYYAPEPVVVTLSILNNRLETDTSGTTFVLNTSEGFNPELTLRVTKGDTNEEGLQKFVSRQQNVLRTFTLELVDENGKVVANKTPSSITIDVPDALGEQEVVSMVVLDNGVYKSMKVEVVNGKVTLDGENISSVSFVQEKDTSNVLIYIIVGVVALILIGGVSVLLLRKRY
jgi:hypothetical protein